MDRDNRVAMSSIEGALNVMERNNLGTVGVQKSVQIQEEEPFETVEKGMKRILFFICHHFVL